MTLTPTQQAVYDAFQAAGLEPALGLAIAEEESNFNPTAVATNPKDLARGGSYGVCQMSMKTALGLDRTVTPNRLLNPAYCAGLAAKLCVQNIQLAHTKDPSEIFSRYNSGQPFHRAPATTVTYCANANRFLTAWRAKLSAT
jgi:soluble lytic murein transglycosylase-like protein